MRYLLSLPAACALAACVQQPPRDLGNNARYTLALQVIHPEAVNNADPATGMDGRAARAAYERYQKTASEQQQATFAVGLNGTSGTSSTK